jgi:biotin synthase
MQLTGTLSMTILRHDWMKNEVDSLFNQPFLDLLFKAQKIHRDNFPANQVQMSTLLSIKTGACPEDCTYCPQSAHYKTGLKKEKLIPLEDVVREAKAAKEKGASRFCMGAAWRSPPKKDLPQVIEMVKAVKAMGMETCVTLGMLDKQQASALKKAGLDYYNHNLDTSPEYYKKVITTRTYDDRLQTLENVRDSDINVCCGGIIGMGETRDDRVELLLQLANLPQHPQSVPINRLVTVKGTPLELQSQMDDFEFVRNIAIARLMMPKSMVRLSAGRDAMSDAMQTLCFMGGANSIFYGEKLLTTVNPELDRDQQLFAKLGIEPLVPACEPA